MPVQLVRNDITRMRVDAIVNAANHRLSGGSGVNGAIHHAAGPGLAQECLALGGCKTGEAKITGGYLLPCRYVIHTVGPVWRGGVFGESQQLAACYWHSLELAERSGCRSVAFPLISSGVFGYPKDQAMRVAMDAITRFLMESDSDMNVYLVIFEKHAMSIGSKLFKDIRQYIDDNYVEEHTDAGHELRRMQHLQHSIAYHQGESRIKPLPEASLLREKKYAPCLSLDEALNAIDESFSEMVMRLIHEKGMKNAECYKKANLDKKHFSKISNDIHYKPKKTTALALAVALELTLPQTQELLMKAGLALSHSDKFDIIVEYFIKEGRYDIFEINEALFSYDQPLLGCVIA